MLTREDLRIALRKVAESQYAMPEGMTLSDFIEPMTRYIGDTDPVLRDDLIYETFDQWILVRNYFGQDELLGLLDIMLDGNHLFFGFGGPCDDSVFTRAFSVLIIVLILQAHRSKPFIDSNRFELLKAKLFKYYTGERDLRGYVDGSGWAHAAAHGSDAMDELLQCAESDRTVFLTILDSYKRILYNGLYPLYNEEDERMARVVNRMIVRKALEDDVIIQWVDSLASCCDWEPSRSQYISRVNAKNFVRSLYFKLIRHKNKTMLTERLEAVEKLLNRSLRFDQFE